jgi:hypothetical protein
MKVIIPSVDYGDYLYTTLPQWIDLIPTERSNFTVVTVPNDLETQNVAVHNGVRVITTDLWYNNGHKFDKAAAMDRAIVGALEGEVILCLDADVHPVSGSAFPRIDQIDREVLYGCVRLNDKGHIEPPANIPHIKRNGRGDAPESCGGYFQLFRYNYQRKFGSYPTAAEYDYRFAFSFPRAKTINFIRVKHLGQRRVNWEGRNRRVVV